MEWVSIECFTNWLDEKKLVPKPNPVEPHWIELPGGVMRTWPTPTTAGALANFLAYALDGLAPWSSCFLWPRFYGWPPREGGERGSDRVYRTIIRFAGIATECDGPNRLEPSDRDLMLTLLVAHMGIQQGF